MSLRKSTAGFIAFASLAGSTAVGLAAFAAHGLKNIAPQGEQAVIWFTQATDFQMNHALAIILAAVIADRLLDGWAQKIVQLAALLLCFAILFFSGALYSASFNGPQFFAPWGGFCAMIGWLVFGAGAVVGAVRGEIGTRFSAQPAE